MFIHLGQPVYRVSPYQNRECEFHGLLIINDEIPMSIWYVYDGRRCNFVPNKTYVHMKDLTGITHRFTDDVEHLYTVVLPEWESVPIDLVRDAFWPPKGYESSKDTDPCAWHNFKHYVPEDSRELVEALIALNNL